MYLGPAWIVLAIVALGTKCEADPILAMPLGLPALASQPSENSAMVGLGRQLFNDRRLSIDGSVACATCHSPRLVFSDGLARSKGNHRQVGTRNAPSLLNVAYQSSFFWDGRLPTLELQAGAPLTNPVEHGFISTDDYLAAVRSHADYAELFRNAFSVGLDKISFDRVAKALSAFERTLLSANSPFDRFLYGHDPHAMGAAAVRGFEVFTRRARCNACHTIGEKSALLSDGLFHMTPLGLSRSVTSHLRTLAAKVTQAKENGDLERLISSDTEVASLGRYVVTLNPEDIGHFKTPSLRNVALTAPYMHDGSVATLEAAVRLELYGRDNSMKYPIALTMEEQHDLIEYLKTLTSSDVP